MVLNFLHGGAAINVLSRHAGARVAVVDMGVAADLEPHPNLYGRKIAYGTQNMRRGAAMTDEQAQRAMQAGLEVMQAEIQQGLDVLAVGRMGIGNTTAAAAHCRRYDRPVAARGDRAGHGRRRSGVAAQKLT